jgi:hypothetical protein
MRWTSLLSVGLLMVACQEKPAELEIKGPKTSLESIHGDGSLPTFTKKGQELNLRVSAFDEEGRFMGAAKDVQWDVGDRSVATISRSGVLTILSSGETEVVAESGELRATAPVVAQIVDAVRLSGPEDAPTSKEGRTKLPMGETIELEVEVLDDRGERIEEHPIVWEATTYAASVDPADGKGVVEGRAIGFAEIIARARGTQVTGSWNVEVTDWPPGKGPR